MSHSALPSVITGALATLALLVTVGSASAQPASGGATRFDYDYCSPQGDGSTLCAQGRTTYNNVLAPSGNSTTIYHNAGTATYRALGCDITNTSREQTTYTFGTEQTKAYHGTSKADLTFECAGDTVRCQLFFVFSVANGEVRVDRSYSTCP